MEAKLRNKRLAVKFVDLGLTWIICLFSDLPNCMYKNDLVVLDFRVYQLKRDSVF